MLGAGGGETDLDIKLGGHQIEYEDQDFLVRRTFEEAKAKAGSRVRWISIM